MSLHRRSYRRALDKVVAMKVNAVHPAQSQRYFKRWATWWHSVVGLGTGRIIRGWVIYSEQPHALEQWVGSGLLQESKDFRLPY